MAVKKKANKKPRSRAVRSPMAALRTWALTLPDATEHFPWGERVVKVRGKVFVFLGRDGDGEAGLSVKLPHSRELVLTLPGCEPTGYGLGKAGWVSIRLTPANAPPLAVLRAWVLESYRAIAPRTLVEQLPLP